EAAFGIKGRKIKRRRNHPAPHAITKIRIGAEDAPTGSQTGATDQIRPAHLEPAHEDRSCGPIVASREEGRRFPARQKLVDHEPDLGLGWHTSRRRGIGFDMQIFTSRAMSLQKYDRAVSGRYSVPKVGFIRIRVFNRIDSSVVI